MSLMTVQAKLSLFQNNNTNENLYVKFRIKVTPWEEQGQSSELPWQNLSESLNGSKAAGKVQLQQFGQKIYS